MARLVHTRAVSLSGACLLVACGVVPSRAPLGGNYALPESAPAGDRRAPAVSASALPELPASARVTATPAPSDSLALADSGPAAPATLSAAVDTIHFEPLQVGSLIKSEVTLSASAEMRGGAGSMTDRATLALDSRLRAEIKVMRATAQSLDEIQLTLTTLSVHSEFNGQSSDSKQEPPETYEITLSGSSPTMRATSGVMIDPERSLKLALFVVPLAEFYAHWARSPTLELKPGWSSRVSLPFAATLFATGRNEAMHVGPLDAHFSSRAPGSDELPFELSLPVQYVTPLGKLDVELRGSAKLNAKSARPSGFDLSGPLSATGGPRGVQMNLTGKAKLSGSFTYP